MTRKDPLQTMVLASFEILDVDYVDAETIAANFMVDYDLVLAELSNLEQQQVVKQVDDGVYRMLETHDIDLPTVRGATGD